jgi:Cft2 family RNA processing exonuclease
MKLKDLNREGGIGANSLFIQLGDLNILIDCGLNPKKVGRAATPDLGHIRGVRLDLIIITHCHLDHIGSLPVAMRDHPTTPVLMTTSSRILIERMLHNSANVMLRQKQEDNIPDYPLFTHDEIERCAARLTGLPYGHAKHFRGAKDQIEIILHPAGHVVGAAGVELRHKDRAYFFTGDVLFEHLRTLPGAKFPAGHFDAVVLETTRGASERPAGKERVNEVARLITAINRTLEAGGSFLIPVFALGRMQEMLSILHDARRFGRLKDCPIFAAGLGIDLSDYVDAVARKTGHANFSRSIIKELKVKPTPKAIKPGEDMRQKAIYLVSSGMMVEHTPSYMIASGLVGHVRNAIGFVGYCDPDTPGGHLLAAREGDAFEFEAIHVKTKIKAQVERFELSGHADREELAEFAVQTGAKHVVLTHGDQPARDWFAQELGRLMPGTKVIDPVPLKSYQL